MPADLRSLRAPFVLTVAAIAAAPMACGGNADGEVGGTDGGTAGAAGSGVGGAGANPPGFGGTGAAGSSGFGGTGAAGFGGTGANPPGFGGTAGVSGAQSGGAAGFGGVGGAAGIGGVGGAAGIGGVGGAAGIGGVGGAAGMGGAAGAGGAPDCPATLPGPWDTCVAGTQCGFDLDCQSGSISLGFTCAGDASYSYWQVDSQSCVEEFDSCAGTQLYCSGQWWVPQGTNPPSPCPDARPTDGEACSTMDMGGVHEQCGYRCAGPNTPWTVATCVTTVTDGGIYEGHWTFDAACSPGG